MSLSLCNQLTDENKMSNLERSIGIKYGDLAQELAQATVYQLLVQHGIIANITDIGSGDVTDMVYRGKTYEINYSFIFEEEKLVSIRLTSDSNELLNGGLIITVTNSMVSLYNDIMLATHLIEECRKSVMLSDEAKAYRVNWQEVV